MFESTRSLQARASSRILANICSPYDTHILKRRQPHFNVYLKRKKFCPVVVSFNFDHAYFISRVVYIWRLINEYIATTVRFLTSLKLKFKMTLQSVCGPFWNTAHLYLVACVP